MSEVEKMDECEYFSTVNEVREVVNKKIENLIQLMEQRKTFLNSQLDSLEIKIEQEETEGKEVLEKLRSHEKSTIDLFGDSEHLNMIRSKRTNIESELSRKKLKLEWVSMDLENTLGSLGFVTLASVQNNPKSSAYDDVVFQSKMEESKTPISDKDDGETNPDEGSSGRADYESMTPPNENLTETPTRRNPPPMPVKPSIVTSTYKTISSPHQKLSGEKDYILPDDVHLIYETGKDSAGNSPIREEKEIEYFIYRRNSEKFLDMPNRGSKTLRFMSTKKSSSDPECEFGNLEYEIMGSCEVEDSILDYPNYETIDESTIVDFKTPPRSRKEIKIDLPPEKKTSTTLGRYKHKAPKSKFDLPLTAKCWKGSGMGQLDRPKAISISQKGNIFVAEKGNNRVQVFSSEGNHLLSFGEKSGPNKMVEPNGICIYKEFVFVTLSNQNMVQQYTLQGGFIKQKGKKGSEEGRFKLPTGIDADESRSKIYICDTGNNRVQIFDARLHFIKAIQTVLVKPLDIKVLTNGDFIVLDRAAICIHFFTSAGELVKDLIDVSKFHQVVNPLYFTVSREGDIILSDYSNDCIHIFSSEGELIWTLGEAGKGKPLDEPRGVACDKNGRLVTVCNKNYEMLQMFKI